MKKGLTVDDICIRPRTSYVRSRLFPDISTYLAKNLKIDIPIINSPMDSVISLELAEILSSLGSVPIFHRQMKLKELEGYNSPFFISIGVNFPVKEIERFTDKNPRCIGINLDVANGHSIVSLEATEKLKNLFPEFYIMSGAVCTAEGYTKLIEAGADVIRVGIGPGTMCLTRIVTGVGVPQFSAIQEIYEERKTLGVPIISDGGIRNSGDIVKILAAGADCVMIGGLLARTLESAAKKKRKLFSRKKMCFYRGQASESYQKFHYGKIRSAVEGESSWLPCLGHAGTLLKELSAGLRTGMAMLDSNTLDELKRKVEFMEVSSSYLAESGTRK